jgi:hypothetical protein
MSLTSYRAAPSRGKISGTTAVRFLRSLKHLAVVREWLRCSKPFGICEPHSQIYFEIMTVSPSQEPVSRND